MILKEVKIDHGQKYWLDFPNWISYVTYLLMIWLSTKLMLKWLPSLKDNTTIKSENIDKMYPASESFLPIFFAYVFLGLSINNWTSLFCIYAALGIYCMCSEMYLYNPLFYVFGYRFYYIDMNSGTKILLMSKYKFQLGHKTDFIKVKRVNDFSYIDLNRY